MVDSDEAFPEPLQLNLLPIPNMDVATENHFQSLGLNINNGLPKFKLNEPGPAALATSIFQEKNMTTDESEQSFVVLDKTSLETIQETSLASYMQIQKKSTLTDHNSLISLMSPLQIEENLKKVLEENIKLKETLKQNNHSIKQQFNTITMWQKEVMEVCDKHKQKFLETKELISRLKKDNEELREIIAVNQMQIKSLATETAEHSFESIKSTDLLLNKSNCLSTENSVSTSTFAAVSMQKENDSSLFNKEQEYIKKIDELSKELNIVKINYSKTKEVLAELEQRYMTNIELFSQQLQKANKELDVCKQKSDVSNTVELQKLVDKCCEKDTELKYLKEMVTSMEECIKQYEESDRPAIDLQNKTLDVLGSQDTCTLIKHIEFYNDKVRQLGTCFTSQCSRYLQMQEYIRECTNIIQIFENAEILPNSVIPEDKLNNYKENLKDYRKKLINEQLKIIDDKQTTIKLQGQFEKIFSDYNSTIHELEILKDDNLKLVTMKSKETEENMQLLAKLKEQIENERKILDGNKMELLEERLSLQMQQKAVTTDKEKIEGERKSLLLEVQMLEEARKSLVEERKSLDRQSALYEAEKEALQAENKSLRQSCEIMANEMEFLKRELKNSELNIETQFTILQEKENMNEAFKLQMELSDQEFHDLRLQIKMLQDRLSERDN